MLKSKGIVTGKWEFFYQMDLQDLKESSAFITEGEWDFIMKPDDRIVIKPRDFTK